jgi:ATP-dependent DNA helicase RecG
LEERPAPHLWLTNRIRDNNQVGAESWDGSLVELQYVSAFAKDAAKGQQTLTSVDITAGPREERRSLYPVPALQQLVRNAVMHRTYEATNAPVRVYWYDDRIEITSPGGPFGTVSAENFGEPGVADYRNPNLAEALRVLGFVQRFGFGLAIARRALAENGNPPLELSVQPSHVTAIVRSAAPGAT